MGLLSYGNRLVLRRIRAAGLGAILLSIMFMGWAIYQYWDIFSFLHGSISTSGSVVDCRINTHSSNCIPIINFTTQHGQIITIRPNDNNSTSHIGDTMTVWYHPDNPQDGRINVGIVNMLKLVLLPAGALLLFGVGLIVLWFTGDIDLPRLVRKIRAARAESKAQRVKTNLTGTTSAQQKPKRKKNTQKRGRPR